MESKRANNFIEAIVARDAATLPADRTIVTRFPPEPNGYLHIGHAKSIVLNFGLARDFGGRCHLRFDDTNPETEDMEYVASIEEDVRWLGYDWNGHQYHASDYFEELYTLAQKLIRKGLAYVDSQTGAEISANRGTVTTPGTPGPFRDRSVDENIDLFARMRAGEFTDGSHVLRAKIDLASPNMLLRDPVLYRIRHASHYRTGSTWCIYPLYDFAHPLSDAIEGISHSICTLEFDVHRPLYDWLVSNLFDEPRPHQHEFARLNVDYMIMSKRKLLALVKSGHVDGWDDPRMPTLSGMRRRGIPPEAIRRFCEMVGVAKADNRVEIAQLEFAIRDTLNTMAPRVMGVLEPLRVVLTNMPTDHRVDIEASLWPHDIDEEGSRTLSFTREIYIDREDFLEDPPAGYHRLKPGGEVRLRHACIIACTAVHHREDGTIDYIEATADMDSFSGSEGANRKVKGTIQWVPVAESLPVDVYLYDRLFSQANPEDQPEGMTFEEALNPDSLRIVRGARVEPYVGGARAGDRYQFERTGYFVCDQPATEDRPATFNRIITLRDTWSTKQAPKPSAPKRTKSPKTTTRPSNVLVLSERAQALKGTHALSDELAAQLDERDAFVQLLDQLVEAGAPGALAASWIIQELPRREGEAVAPPARHLADLLKRVEDRSITPHVARTVLAEMIQTGAEAASIIARDGLGSIQDTEALVPMVDQLLAAFPDKVAAFRAGKTGLQGFFVGQIMRQTGGSADPETVLAVLTPRLHGDNS